MSLYEIYERLRKEKGLSNADVGRATGISTATLSQWKSGKYTPKMDKLEKIASFLSVPVEYLITGKLSSIDCEASKIAQYVIENETTRLIMEGVQGLDEKERAWVLEAIRFINKKKEMQSCDIKTTGQ